ncbi:MAG: UDP-N-acetylmuramate--L-alanine ligase [Phycisphaera sp.]|nr:UDP-N-acetylmuramate--L-alanine ligase [Phycisphaera sp.]
MISPATSRQHSQALPRDTEWADPNAPLHFAQKNVHFVGIGGCGMSGLARIVRAAGGVCSGTDLSPSEYTEALEADGIDVILEQTAESVPGDADVLVVSAAIRGDHPEVVEAKRRGLPVLKYAQVVGRLMIGRTGVAIAGTHGKSTTTSMLSHILLQTGLDPTFIVGAICEQIGGGARVGNPDMLVAEACEYDRSFHNFRPTHGVILNVEEDHLDIYGSLDAIIESFHHFGELIRPDGTLLISHERAYRTNVAAGLECDVETIGFGPQADWHVEQVRQSKTRIRSQVVLRHEGEVVCEFRCRMPGEHMAYNAAVAAVTAHRMGAMWDGIAKAIGSFRGLGRRMQVMGVANGVTVIDDYGHHPTEIDTTLRALRDHYHPETRGGRLICVFQPHQHSRTRFLLDQFATSFEEADVVVVPEIYFVRDSEEDRRAVSAADLVYKLQQRGVLAVHIDDFKDITRFLTHHCKPNDLLVAMGAGPVWQIAKGFLESSQ